MYTYVHIYIYIYIYMDISAAEIEGACARMFLWHIIFGEPLAQPHRMYDPSLPLFLKTRNIRTAYMDEADGV